MPTGIPLQRDLEALPGHEGRESARPRRRSVSRQKVIADRIAKLEEFPQIAAVVARAFQLFSVLIDPFACQQPATRVSSAPCLMEVWRDRPFRWHPVSLDASVRGSCPNVPPIR